MSDPFEKWPRWLLWLIDRTSGGCVYQNQSMSEHGIPPVPAWTVSWFFDLKRWWRPTPRQEKSDDEEIPFEQTKLPDEHPRRKDEPMAFEFFSLPMIPWAECHGARRISVGPSEDGGKWYVMIDRGSSESERVEPGEVAIVADVGPFSTEAEAWGWVKALFMEHVQ